MEGGRNGGREEWREGGREEGREGGREGGKNEGKEGELVVTAASTSHLITIRAVLIANCKFVSELITSQKVSLVHVCTCTHMCKPYMHRCNSEKRNTHIQAVEHNVWLCN